jgi:hypothetical protein
MVAFGVYCSNTNSETLDQLYYLIFLQLVSYAGCFEIFVEFALT